MATPPEYRQADDEREGLTLRDYLGVMWRRKWIIILVTVVATGAAFGFSYRQAKVYQAQADLIYEQQLDVANPLTGQTYTDPNARSLGAQLRRRHHQERADRQPRAAALLEEEGMPTTGFTVSSELAEAGTTTGTDEQRGLDLRHQRGPGAGGGGLAGLRRRLRRAGARSACSAQIDAAIKAVEKEMRNYPGSPRSPPTT